MAQLLLAPPLVQTLATLPSASAQPLLPSVPLLPLHFCFKDTQHADLCYLGIVSSIHQFCL